MEVKIILSEEERQNQKMHDITFRRAKHLFEVHGFLKVENVFEKEFVQQMAEAYLLELQADMGQMELNKGTKVSNGRFIVPIPIKGPFNDPRLYANPFIGPLFSALLGRDHIIGSMGSVTSLPGATEQHLHADYFPLFEENTALCGTLPTYAITFGVPLVDIDCVNGPTIVWSSSHKTYPIEMAMHSYEKHLVHGPLGSCYFWDYRTFHAGGSNHSDALRPLLYIGFTRKWFNDFLNPDHLIIEDEEYQKIPEEHRHLFLKFARGMQGVVATE